MRLGLAGAPPWAAVGLLVSTSVRVSVPTANGPGGAGWAGVIVVGVVAVDELPAEPEPQEARVTTAAAAIAAIATRGLPPATTERHDRGFGFMAS